MSKAVEVDCVDGIEITGITLVNVVPLYFIEDSRTDTIRY